VAIKALSPITSRLSRTPRSAAVSMMTQLAPIVIGPLSANTIAPNPIYTFGPIETSPQRVAFGAMRTDGSRRGRLALCSRIAVPP